ncbi:RnfABCDGE type electron transport complex subunit B [Nitrosovibrio tenuis]|uniref:Electron transport complex protein RnfB n=1 Tax=Nitrosovibrio tenuis TaxID=1233 RepID=A0A1H7LFI7_9PROT|nr:RnfABCDGE type electron transport complex subunit B [Nitrosovibrio tenuis]SEK97610.1 electron transport complex protein RnfB [Nitrosovibrio tenuis]
MTRDQLIVEIDGILPQTQCRQCGFAGCRPYATAIAEGLADINQCSPGGKSGILKLAGLLGVSPKPLNTAHGFTKPRAVALINEQACIGCTLCILACPVDAIVGAAKQAHTVITEECTGCELCIAPCPMDCISMAPPRIPALGENSNDSKPHLTSRGYRTDADEKKAADRARARHRFRLLRLEREKQEREEKLVQKAEAEKDINVSPAGPSATGNTKKAMIQAALERAMAARVRLNDKNDGCSTK